jgi:hypothetical protein
MKTKNSDVNLPARSLTVDDCDKIDLAKGRALRLVTAVSHLLNSREHLEGLTEELDDAALLDMLDVIREDLTMITAVLHTADGRRTSGGAR